MAGSVMEPIFVKLTQCVVPDVYTMPNTQELLDQLAGASWFSVLDLGSAFWQLPLDEKSRDCTAFMARTHGLLCWNALPLGFKNSLLASSAKSTMRSRTYA